MKWARDYFERAAWRQAWGNLKSSLEERVGRSLDCRSLGRSRSLGLTLVTVPLRCRPEGLLHPFCFVPSCFCVRAYFLERAALILASKSRAGC
jgi:hypothetical protein